MLQRYQMAWSLSSIPAPCCLMGEISLSSFHLLKPRFLSKTNTEWMEFQVTSAYELSPISRRLCNIGTQIMPWWKNFFFSTDGVQTLTTGHSEQHHNTNWYIVLILNFYEKKPHFFSKVCSMVIRRQLKAECSRLDAAEQSKQSPRHST